MRNIFYEYKEKGEKFAQLSGGVSYASAVGLIEAIMGFPDISDAEKVERCKIFISAFNEEMKRKVGF